jgi:hypothetical protein
VVDALRSDWDVAAADAGVDTASVVLDPLQATGDYGAMHFPPGRWPHGYDDDFAYDDDHRAALYQLRDRHVLVVAYDLPSPRRILVLRHEAEHVAQHDANPGGAEVALRLAVGLPRAMGWLYVAMPHERDADAAATLFALNRGIGGTPDDLEGNDRFLYGAPWPAPDRESLPLRLLAFTLFYARDFDLACTSNQFWPHVDPTAIADEMIPGGATARAAMRQRFSGFLEEIAVDDITQEDWERMPRAEQNAVNDPIRAQVVEAETSAVEELRERLVH